MSRYNFQLSDYHAIKRASVDVDGITVLAGENGSGKSTLARWLYYVINVATDFDVYLTENYGRRLGRILRNVSRVRREIEMKEELPVFSEFHRLSFKGEERDSLAERAHAYVDAYASGLSAFLSSKEVSEFRKRRVAGYLGVEFEGNDATAIVDAFSQTYHGQIDQMGNELRRDIRERSADRFYQLIKEHFNEQDEPPLKMSFSEDDVELLSERTIGTLLNAERVIYIDTPTVVGGEDFGNVFWEELEAMMTVRHVPEDLREKEDGYRFLKMMLGRILRGKIEIKKNIFDGSKLFYEREDGLSIELSKVSTGMKSFAYLLQLLRNGYLDEKTILLIDEPEAHLHPQWVVEFAKVLVFLHSKLGVKVMVASHNPDMVAAIQAISRRQGIAESVHFYLAEEDEGKEFKYNFRDLGDSIEPIFESFNIALARIQQYGDSNI